jgi:hypothetical protein
MTPNWRRLFMMEQRLQPHRSSAMAWTQDPGGKVKGQASRVLCEGCSWPKSPPQHTQPRKCLSSVPYGELISCWNSSLGTLSKRSKNWHLIAKNKVVSTWNYPESNLWSEVNLTWHQKPGFMSWLCQSQFNFAICKIIKSACLTQEFCGIKLELMTETS